jgi:uncharacterized membrane protein
MNKDGFLNELDRLLREIPKKERQEILSDFKEHFTIGFNEGKTEEEIIRELGDPKVIAEEARSDYEATKSERPQPVANATRCILAGIGMIFFNLVVVLGPLVGIFSIYLSFCIVSAVFIVSPLLSIGTLFDSGGTPFLFAFFSSLILCGAGILLGIAMIFIGKFLWRVFTGYLRFNVNVVMGRKRS